MFTLPTLPTSFADTSADQLSFSLSHPRLPALATTRIELSDLFIDTDSVLELNVIGSSHQVILGAPGANEFIETFACLDAGATDEDLVTSSGTGPPWERTLTSTRPHPGIGRHDFTCHRQVIDHNFPAAVARVVDRVRSQKHHVLVVFPGAPDALTAMSLDEVVPDRISWRTWHAYPQHTEIVTSVSELKMQTTADSDRRIT